MRKSTEKEEILDQHQSSSYSSLPPGSFSFDDVAAGAEEFDDDALDDE